MLFVVQKSEEMLQSNSTLCNRRAVLKRGLCAKNVTKVSPTEAVYNVSFR